MVSKRFIKLRGRIMTMFGTHEAFAREMKISRSTLSSKLNSKVDWSGTEIARACALLDIPQAKHGNMIFFRLIVAFSQQREEIK